MTTIKTIEEFKQLEPEQQVKTYLCESLTSAYPIAECGEGFVSLRDLAQQMNLPVLFAPEVEPESNVFNGDLFLRVGAAQRVMQAAASILDASDNVVTVKITCAFRPLEVQRQLFQKISAQIAEETGLSGQALWERVTQFIADPDLCPPHSTGGAVDLTLSYKSGEELDMGTSVNAIDSRANTWHAELSEEAVQNRKRLYDAMIQAGFVNLPTEWWHYSFGDQYWAVTKHEAQAIYGSQEHL